MQKAECAHRSPYGGDAHNKVHPFPSPLTGDCVKTGSSTPFLFNLEKSQLQCCTNNIVRMNEQWIFTLKKKGVERCTFGCTYKMKFHFESTDPNISVALIKLKDLDLLILKPPPYSRLYRGTNCVSVLNLTGTDGFISSLAQSPKFKWEREGGHETSRASVYASKTTWASRLIRKLHYKPLQLKLIAIL